MKASQYSTERTFNKVRAIYFPKINPVNHPNYFSYRLWEKKKKSPPEAGVEKRPFIYLPKKMPGQS